MIINELRQSKVIKMKLIYSTNKTKFSLIINGDQVRLKKERLMYSQIKFNIH